MPLEERLQACGRAVTHPVPLVPDPVIQSLKTLHDDMQPGKRHRGSGGVQEGGKGG
ncbi:hypothetical protein GCM10010393_29680 [Streptomyces gobitricini]|uniref:Uncharacterized protein n=1 Tax=Streptomyces gobitricini TaxID=68211 RepID=A0ABP5ZB94_9ACTN